MRLIAYGAISTLLATFAVFSAFRQRANFYAASVYLSKSNACMMILCNFGIFCTIILSKLLQSIFFGKLRSVELDRLNDRLWFTVTETLLALAMFRDEFDTTFVVLFISLIFVKCFHWLASDRVEWMDEAVNSPGRLFHARMISVLSLIWWTDLLLIAYATESVLLHGPSVVLMFEMEYIIMQVTCLSIISKYILNSYGQYRAQEHWEGKSIYLFYIELATDFLKLLTYIGFLTVTVAFYGLPINVLRDVYYTARSFISKCNNLRRFRQATRNMNERYPNATREEMNGLADKTCIICREDMEFRDENNPPPAADQLNNNNNNVDAASPGPNDTPKKLLCGHIFHFHCLRSWLERQQTCPTCRRPVLQPQAITAARTAAVNDPVPPMARNPALPQPNLGVGPAAGQQPLAPPAPQPQAANDINSFDFRANLRNDVLQRFRDLHSRLPANTNATPSGPSNTTNSTSHFHNNPFRPLTTPHSTLPNPLVSFEIPDPPCTIPRSPPNNPLAAGPSSSTATVNPPQSSNLTQNSNQEPHLSHTLNQSVPFESANSSSTTNILSHVAESHSPSHEPKNDPLKHSDQTLLDINFQNKPSTTESDFTQVNSSTLNIVDGGDVASSTLAHPIEGMSLVENAVSSQKVRETDQGLYLNQLETPRALSSGINLGSKVKEENMKVKEIDFPCLIPLFDTDVYQVPDLIKKSFMIQSSDWLSNKSFLEESLMGIPNRIRKGESKRKGEKDLDEKMKILAEVQRSLLDCSRKLERCLEDGFLADESIKPDSNNNNQIEVQSSEDIKGKGRESNI
ncbi:hypothetical protein O181_065131 [Austropuccinia psidii MF-1]|uniref:RING-type E3 ubiquitin transferase n=1 Tax=Austropuccinia psidii MF-1 TaxID=1389203 RepID=A0A9Q3I0Z1_9BASI|nr:hypothetical protein [Austropuccinia psidii MF-1]